MYMGGAKSPRIDWRAGGKAAHPSLYLRMGGRLGGGVEEAGGLISISDYAFRLRTAALVGITLIAIAQR